MLRFSEDLIPMMKVLSPGDDMDQIGPVKERLNLDKEVSYRSDLAVYIFVKKHFDSLNRSWFNKYEMLSRLFFRSSDISIWMEGSVGQWLVLCLLK